MGSAKPVDPGATEVRARAERRIIDALALSSHYSLGLEVARCIEASLGGAAALQSHGIDAKVIPCAAIAASADRKLVAVLGHRLETALTHPLAQVALAGPPELHTRGHEYPFHFAILATLVNGRHVFCDLTSWQLRQSTQGALRVPLAVVGELEGYPVLDGEDGSVVEYMACPYPERVMSQLEGPPMPAEFVESLLVLIDEALACDLDREALAVRVRELKEGAA
jgi:hypothetical protein